MYFDLQTKAQKQTNKKDSTKEKSIHKQKSNIKRTAQNKIKQNKTCTSTLNAAFQLGINCEIFAPFMLVVQCMTTQWMLFGWNLP